MATLETRYLPSDRLAALAAGVSLPSFTTGSALFADISGFTPMTEHLRLALGARRGAETLAAMLNRVYNALVVEVERFGGSILSFSGDAITCWFDGNGSALSATECGLAMMAVMRAIDHVVLPDGESIQLGLKVAIASGKVHRMVVGDPSIQQIDVLAGATIARMAIGEEIARRGEVVIDAVTADVLGSQAQIDTWREAEGNRFAVLNALDDLPTSPTIPQNVPNTLDDMQLRPWLLPAVVGHFQAGLGEYLTELRPAVALFLRFTGINYDDAQAEARLDQLVRLVQTIIARYDGSVLQLTIGDKGSYLYAAFGAPLAHEDDTVRALNAASDIREQLQLLGMVDPVQIGLSRGVMRTGAYGGETRRTYGVLGDEVNLAARLMSQAAPGEILISETLLGARLEGFTLAALPPLEVKGKAHPVGVLRLIGRREPTFEERFYTTPLVGRDDELTILRKAVESLFAGRHAGLIYLYGEAGIGKSRLAHEFQTRLQAEAKMTWFTGQSDDLNRAPFAAFTYFLRPYFGQRRDQEHAINLAAFDSVYDALVARADAITQADLILYRSFLAGLIGLILPESHYEQIDETLRIDNIIAALKAWVRAESQSQPLVLHLEDAQWLDASSVRAVQNLTYNLGNTPLLLLLTSRPNDDERFFEIRQIYEVPIHTLALKRLGNESVQTIAEAVLQAPISMSFVQFIRDHAEGNPFFTEQLALDVQERGLLVEQDGILNLRLDMAADIPSSVNAVLIARLDRLAAQVKAVVQTASVLGREFDVQVLSQMLREGERPYIEVAEGEAIWTALDAIRYLFRHALLRDAAYQMQVRERLKMLHRLAAETIETLYPDDATQYEALLEHWHTSGELDRELRYLDPVVKRLIDITAQYDLAGEVLTRALEALGDSDIRRIMPLNWISALHLKRGNFTEAQEAAQQARLLASPDNRAALALSLHRLGVIANSRDAYAEGRDYLEQSLAIQREIGDRAGIAANFSSLGALMQRQGAYAEARDFLEQSLALWRDMGDRERIANSLNQLGVVARMQGQITEARAYIEQSLEIRREIGDRAGIAASLTQLGTVARMQGNYEESQTLHEQAIVIKREIGDRLGLANSLISVGNIWFGQGKFTEARSYFERSLETIRQVGEPLGISGNLNNLGVVSVLQGDYQAAEAYYQESLTIRREIGDRRGIADTVMNLGTLTFRQGNYQAAEPYHRESLDLHRELNDGFVNSSRSWLARTLIRLDRFEEVRDLLREGIQIHRQDDIVHKLALCMVAAEWYWKQSRWESAAELAGLILSSTHTDVEFRNDVEALLAELRLSLDAEVVDRALERGKSLNLDDRIKQLIAEVQ